MCTHERLASFTRSHAHTCVRTCSHARTHTPRTLARTHLARAHAHTHTHTHTHTSTHTHLYTPLHTTQARADPIALRCRFTLAVEAAASPTTADALQRHTHAAQSAPCGLCTAYPARGGTRSCSWPRAAVGCEARPALGGTSECCAVQRYSEHRSLKAGSGWASHRSVGDSQSRAMGGHCDRQNRNKTARRVPVPVCVGGPGPKHTRAGLAQRASPGRIRTASRGRPRRA